MCLHIIFCTSPPSILTLSCVLLSQCIMLRLSLDVSVSHTAAATHVQIHRNQVFMPITMTQNHVCSHLSMFCTLFLNSTLHNVLLFVDASYFLLIIIYFKNFQILTKCILCIWSLCSHATGSFKYCVSSLDVSSLVQYCIFTDLKVKNHLGGIPFQYLCCCEDMLRKGGGLKMNPRWKQQEVAFP